MTRSRHLLLALCVGVGATIAVASMSSVAFASSGAPSTVTALPPGTVQPPFQATGPDPATIPLALSQCPTLALCLWANSGYGGYVLTLTGSNSGFAYIGDAYNNTISSIWNRRNNASFVAADYPSSSRYSCIGGGGGWEYSNLAGNTWYQDGSGANDSISSYWLSSDTYNNCSGQPQFK